MLIGYGGPACRVRRVPLADGNVSSARHTPSVQGCPSCALLPEGDRMVACTRDGFALPAARLARLGLGHALQGLQVLLYLLVGEHVVDQSA